MLKCLNVSSSYTGPERVKQRARVTRWYLFVILQTSAPPVRQAATPTPPYSSCGYCTNIWFTNSIAKYALVYLTVIFPPLATHQCVHAPTEACVDQIYDHFRVMNYVTK